MQCFTDNFIFQIFGILKFFRTQMLLSDAFNVMCKCYTLY